jgi:hypothetical protein
MVDAFTMLVSHGMLLFVLWRLLKLRDPDEPGGVRGPVNGDRG